MDIAIMVFIFIIYFLIGISTWFPIEYAANSKHPDWHDEGHLERDFIIIWIFFYPLIFPFVLLYWLGKNIGKILIAIYVTIEIILSGKTR